MISKKKDTEGRSSKNTMRVLHVTCHHCGHISKFDMEAKQQREMKHGLITFMVVIALAVSVISLCISLFRSEPVTVDWAGVLVGALSIMIMILLGWQVVSSLTFEKRVGGKIRDVAADLKSEVEKAKHESIIYSSSSILYSSAHNLVVSGDYELAMRVLTYAIIIRGDNTEDSCPYIKDLLKVAESHPECVTPFLHDLEEDARRKLARVIRASQEPESYELHALLFPNTGDNKPDAAKG
jgi:hypothetical protein